MAAQKSMTKKWAKDYDQENILDEIIDEWVTLTVEEGLREDIRSGKRKRKLKNISIKMDPLHVQAIKKLATMKSIPYQTLMRHWLAEDIREELDSVTK
jgi:predicted DNA binding CopG/RHH family protein